MARRTKHPESDRQPNRPETKPPVPLTGVLSEFRDALNAEVEAAKRASASGAIPLLNGRRIGTLGGGFQYQFDIESALDLPGDAPGELRVPGLDPIRVSVVAFEGLTVIVNTEVDLGQHIGVASLQSDLSMLLLKLIERIEKKSTVANPAGERLLGGSAPNGDAEVVTSELFEPHGFGGQDGFRLNREQLAAVGSVLGRDTTYIWGPPGTGKTLTIGAIGAELFRRGQSLLVVSHTNTAVDGAILAIGKAVRHTASDDIEKGLVIRVGTPKDARLKSEDNAALLLSEQRDRRQVQLIAKRSTLEAERAPLLARERYLLLIIELHDWLSTAEPDLDRFARELARLQATRETVSTLAPQIDAIEPQVRAFQSHAKVLDTALQAVAAAEQCRTRLTTHASERDNASSKLDTLAHRVKVLQDELAKAREIEPHRVQLSRLPALDTAKDTLAQLARQQSASESEAAHAVQMLHNAQRVLAETESVNWITRKWRGLPDPTTQRSEVNAISQRAAHAQAGLAATASNRQRADETVRTIEEVVVVLAPYSHLARPAEIQRRLDGETSQLQRSRGQLELSQKRLEAAQLELASCDRTISDFRAIHQCEPSVFADRGRALQQRLDEMQRARREAMDADRHLTDSLLSELGRALTLLRSLDLTGESPSTLEDMYASVAAGVEQARLRAAAIPRVSVSDERQSITSRLKAIASELDVIENELKRVEAGVIRDARVVGATLTASYLRDAIQSRRFDTVLLDEASMAAIPALWMAASLADRSLAVVGDYLQLPPVVVATDPLALKWLGRDPFELVGLHQTGPKPEHFIGLREQHRMHPLVSAIASSLVYESRLIDHPSTKSREAEPIDWLSADWAFGDPVLLVDTGPLHAWVTPVSRGGGNASRLNFMSATVCADIASRLLSDARTPWARTDDPRVLVIAPYRPHSRLISLLLRDDGLGDEVVAGTVHSFQGSQADVVILDLVNDEPHWKVGHFMAQNDAASRRLFNVAITRAKRRLLVVGDFAYCEKQGRKAFLGKKLLPYLRTNHRLVNAIDVVPEGIASRAASARSRVFGGSVEAAHERIVIRQDRFYSLLVADLEAATTRVVIYSPFMTHSRVGEIEAHLRAAIERGVSVFVVTKPLEERGRAERATYQALEGTLARWRVHVVHKKGMHEKLVLIDRLVLWQGSLNPLSFRDTQEVMERRRSAEVFEEYAKTLEVEELLDEATSQTPCPICGGEVAAAEGGATPFYWRCLGEGCAFQRSTGDHTIRDGDVKCRKCGGEVKLVEKDKDGRARWWCMDNGRHKQLVRAMELQLPKVRARYSESRLDRLERRFAEGSKSTAKRKGRKRKADGESLFR